MNGGEGCPGLRRALETSRRSKSDIFKFGTRYSVPLAATVLDADGADVPLVMGSYGIGLGRLLAAVVEEHHDRDGIIWPLALAPFAVTVLILGQAPSFRRSPKRSSPTSPAQAWTCFTTTATNAPASKLKDADLIGIPLGSASANVALADGSRVEASR